MIKKDCLICSLNGELRLQIENAASLKEAKQIALDNGLAYAYLSHISNHRKYHSKISQKIDQVVKRDIFEVTPHQNYEGYGQNHLDDLSVIQSYLARIMVKILVLTEGNLDYALNNNELPSKDLIDSAKKLSEIYSKYHGVEISTNVSKAVELLTNLGYTISEE